MPAFMQSLTDQKDGGDAPPIYMKRVVGDNLTQVFLYTPHIITLAGFSCAEEFLKSKATLRARGGELLETYHGTILLSLG